MALLSPIFLACITEVPFASAAPPSVAAETMSWQIAGAIILKETTYDTPIKTQVELRVSIPRGTTKAELDAYLRGIYEQQMARDGFKARNSPNSVYVFVYPEGTPSDGLGWVGRVAKPASDDNPTFDNLLVGRAVVGAREALRTNANPDPMETSVEQTVEGLRVLVHHTKQFWNNEYAEEPYKIFAWQRMFYAAEVLYGTVPDVDRVHILVQHHKTVLIEAHLTAKMFAALRFGETMKDVMTQIGEISEQVLNGKLSRSEADAKERQADINSFKTLFNRLPPGVIKFHPSVEL